MEKGKGIKPSLILPLYSKLTALSRIIFNATCEAGMNFLVD